MEHPTIVSMDSSAALNSFYRLFDEVPFMVAAFKGPSLVIEYVNKFTLHFWQLTREEVIGKPLAVARPDIQQQTLAVHDHVYKTGKRFKADEVPLNITTDGITEVRYFNCIIDPMFNDTGSIVGQLATTIEVTEQVLARKKTEDSEQLFRFALDGAEMGTFDFYPQTGKLTWSEKTKEHFGLPPDAETSFEVFLQALHPDDRERSKTITQEALRPENGGHYENEYRTIGITDGKLRWVRSKGKISFDSDGRAIRMAGVTHDITARKNAEEQLKESEERFRHLANQLEALVDERTKELQRSNEDLQQFAHVASHDLKEPVRKIMTFTNRLKDELDSTKSEKTDKYISKIESSAARMYAMIDGVLLYSSLNALEQTAEIIDLEDLVESIESDLELLINQKNARIIYKDLPSITASSILIYQLFYNLINNSLKFSRPDLPAIIQVKQGELTQDEIAKAGLNISKRYIKIMVEDNGIGFSNEEAANIFGAFTRLHSKDKYEGTGLGLALCKKIAERHGGAIYANGKENELAAFHIILPE